MKIIKSCVLLLVIVAAFSSCKKKDPAPENLTNPVPWIAVGNEWVYAVTGGFSGYDTIKNKIISNNNGIYTLETHLDNDLGENAYLYYKDGFLNWYDQGQSRAANQFFYKYPNAAVGDSWVRITPTETYTHTVVSVNESVTVPAGTFICKKIHITFQNAFNDQDDYISDQYGIIKVDNLFLTEELARKNF